MRMVNLTLTKAYVDQGVGLDGPDNDHVQFQAALGSETQGSATRTRARLNCASCCCVVCMLLCPHTRTNQLSSKTELGCQVGVMDNFAPVGVSLDLNAIQEGV